MRGIWTRCLASKGVERWLTAARARLRSRAAMRASCGALTYPDELCEADAQASGLEAEALRDQVLELCERIRRGDEPPGSPAARLDGASDLDRARALAGVPMGCVHSSDAANAAHPAPWNRTPASPPAPALGFAGNDSSAAAASGGHGHWGKVRSTMPLVETNEGAHTRGVFSIADVAEAALEQQKPAESSRYQRAVQHISAAVAPLAQAAAAYGSGGSSMAAAGVAGIVGVGGGLTQSIATHEHHSQAQEMSRRLQRVALEQERTSHDVTHGCVPCMRCVYTFHACVTCMRYMRVTHTLHTRYVFIFVMHALCMPDTCRSTHTVTGSEAARGRAAAGASAGAGGVGAGGAAPPAGSVEGAVPHTLIWY